MSRRRRAGRDRDGVRLELPVPACGNVPVPVRRGRGLVDAALCDVTAVAGRGWPSPRSPARSGSNVPGRPAHLGAWGRRRPPGADQPGLARRRPPLRGNGNTAREAEPGARCRRLASAEATDRWAALVLAAYTQPRLASALVDDLRRPWHNKPAPGQMLSPYRVRLDSAASARCWAFRPGRRKPPGPARPPQRIENRPKARPVIYRKSDNGRTVDSGPTKQDP